MHINKIFFAGGYSPASCFFSGADSVKNTAALALATHNEEIIFVKDLAAGGTFFHTDSAISPDKGVVFARKAGGVWMRSFDKEKG